MAVCVVVSLAGLVGPTGIPASAFSPPAADNNPRSAQWSGDVFQRTGHAFAKKNFSHLAITIQVKIGRSSPFKLSCYQKR